jgi:uncharacterized protein YceH (UPF0502 family)
MVVMELNFNERRVLGVLVEKGFTTPEQYPLSLNALVNGCNQKSCRDPMTYLGEEDVVNTIDTLRVHGLATLVRAAGSRVDKYRHHMGDALELSSKERALVAELLLRGPQTDGELRQRAGRMVTFESLDQVRELLDSLLARETPVILRLGPADRRRGVKFAHNYYSESEKEAVLAAAAEEQASGGAASAAPRAARGAAVDELRAEIDALKGRVEQLEETLRQLQG